MNKKSRVFLSSLAEMAKFEHVGEVEQASRRVWLQNLGLITASSAVLWHCGKKSSSNANAATGTSNPKTDAALYGAAMAIENSAIGTYMAAAGLDALKNATSGTVENDVLTIAGAFLAHHQAHFDDLNTKYAALVALDSTIAAAPSKTTTAATLDAATTALLTKSSTTGSGQKTTDGVVNVVRLAAAAELSAAQAYVGTISKFTDPTNATIMGWIGCDEAGHFGVLRAALAAVLVDSQDTSLTLAKLINSENIDNATSTAPA